MNSQLLRRFLLVHFVCMLLVAAGLSAGRELNIAGGTTATTVMALLASVLVAGIFFRNSVLLPLRSVLEGVKEFGAGKYDHRVRISSHGEVGAVADELNLVGQKLGKRVSKLETATREAVESNELLTTVLGSMVEGVVVVDPGLKMLYFNEAVRRLLNFTAVDAVTGRTIWELVRNSKVQELARSVLETQEVRSLEFEFGRTKKTLQLVASPLPGEPCSGCVLVFHDVTELRRLEGMRRDFVSNVSHELKTPLTAIQAYTETLLEGALNDKKINRRFLEQIGVQADRLHSQILDLLTLARIESGDESFEIRPVSISAAVADCIDEHRAVAESSRVDLVVEGSSDQQLGVLTDAYELRTILDNLVDNAIKYTPEGGEVRVCWSLSGKQVLIKVCDTGIGIAQDHLDRVFERFYRADKARSRDKGGTGLGLAIVKHLVQQFGGDVSVSSEPGSGTQFNVVLPAAQA